MDHSGRRGGRPEDARARRRLAESGERNRREGEEDDEQKAPDPRGALPARLDRRTRPLCPHDGDRSRGLKIPVEYSQEPARVQALAAAPGRVDGRAALPYPVYSRSLRRNRFHDSKSPTAFEQGDRHDPSFENISARRGRLLARGVAAL